MPGSHLLKHPIDHIDVEMHMLVQAGAQTVGKVHWPIGSLDRFLVRPVGPKQTRPLLSIYFTLFALISNSINLCSLETFYESMACWYFPELACCLLECR